MMDQEKTGNLVYWNCVKCSKELEQILREGNYAQTIAKFQNGEYKAINLEKIRNYDKLYSIRVKGKDRADRLLFTFNSGSRDALILAVVSNHNYEAAFREIKESLTSNINTENFVEISRYANDTSSQTLTPTLNIPQCDESVYYGKSIFPLSNYQLEVIQEPNLPLIINGTAGSGKTVVAEQLILSAQNNPNFNKIYYFGPTEGLVDFMAKEIGKISSEKDNPQTDKIIISTYQNYAKSFDHNLDICGLENFRSWYETNQSNLLPPSTTSKSKKKNKGSKNNIWSTEKVYAELCIAAPYSKQGYIDLGSKQSSLGPEEREKLFQILQSYLNDEMQSNKFDPNLQLFSTIREIPEQDKGLVVIDESQSFSGCAIQNLRDLSLSGKNILFIGDSAQNMLSSVSNLPFIKSLFFDDKTGKSYINEIQWIYSFRCPQRVVQAASTLLQVKQSITKEKKSSSTNIAAANTLDTTENSKEKGLLYFYNSEQKVQFFINQIKQKSSTDTVIIIPNNDYIQVAKDRFDSLQAVTPREFLGMGARNVIMYRCFEKKAPTLSSEADLNNASLSEEERIAINELFVSMTRSEYSLTICETNTHNTQFFLDKLELDKLHEESIKDTPLENLLEGIQSSTDEEWKDKIIEWLKHGGENVARRICEAKFKKNVEAIYNQCLAKANMAPAAKNTPSPRNNTTNDSATKGDVTTNSNHQGKSSSYKIPKKIDAKDKNGNTELMRAAAEGNEKAVTALIQNKARLDLINNKRKTALILAAEKGHTKIVSLLLRGGAKIYAGQNEALFSASGSGLYQDIKPLIVNNKANPNCIMTHDLFGNSNTVGYTPIMLAAANNHPKAVEELLKYGANQNIQKAYHYPLPGHTALMIASKTGMVEIVSILLKNKNTDINLKDKKGQTALMLAALFGKIEVVRLLLSNKKTDRDIRDNNGKTALDLANKEEIISLFSELNQTSSINSKRAEDIGHKDIDALSSETNKLSLSKDSYKLSLKDWLFAHHVRFGVDKLDNDNNKLAVISIWNENGEHIVEKNKSTLIWNQKNNNHDSINHHRLDNKDYPLTLLIPYNISGSHFELAQITLTNRNTATEVTIYNSLNTKYEELAKIINSQLQITLPETPTKIINYNDPETIGCGDGRCGDAVITLTRLIAKGLPTTYRSLNNYGIEVNEQNISHSEIFDRIREKHFRDPTLYLESKNSIPNPREHTVSNTQTPPDQESRPSPFSSLTTQNNSQQPNR